MVLRLLIASTIVLQLVLLRTANAENPMGPTAGYSIGKGTAVMYFSYSNKAEATQDLNRELSDLARTGAWVSSIDKHSHLVTEFNRLPIDTVTIYLEMHGSMNEHHIQGVAADGSKTDYKTEGQIAALAAPIKAFNDRRTAQGKLPAKVFLMACNGKSCAQQLADFSGTDVVATGDKVNSWAPGKGHTTEKGKPFETFTANKNVLTPKVADPEEHTRKKEPQAFDLKLGDLSKMRHPETLKGDGYYQPIGTVNVAVKKAGSNGAKTTALVEMGNTWVEVGISDDKIMIPGFVNGDAQKKLQENLNAFKTGADKLLESARKPTPEPILPPKEKKQARSRIPTLLSPGESPDAIASRTDSSNAEKEESYNGHQQAATNIAEQDPSNL